MTGALPCRPAGCFHRSHSRLLGSQGYPAARDTGTRSVGSPHPDLPVDSVAGLKGTEFPDRCPARILNRPDIEIRVPGMPDTDKADHAPFAYDNVEREHTSRFKGKDHESLFSCPFLCFGYCPFGRVFPGHEGPLPIAPGATVSRSRISWHDMCSHFCTAAGCDPPSGIPVRMIPPVFLVHPNDDILLSKMYLTDVVWKSALFA